MKVVGYRSYPELIAGSFYFKECSLPVRLSMEVAKKKAVLDSSYVLVCHNDTVSYLYTGGSAYQEGEKWIFIPKSLEDRIYNPVKALAEDLNIPEGTIEFQQFSDKSSEVAINKVNGDVSGIFLSKEKSEEYKQLLHPITSCIPLRIKSIIFPAVLGKSSIPLVLYYKTDISEQSNTCSLHFVYNFTLPWLNK